MLSLSNSIIINVGAEYIETYLKKKGFVRTEEQRGQGLKYWTDELMKAKQINIDDFEEFLFEELFWGKRKLIRVYKLDKIKDYRLPEDWENGLEEHYGISSLAYSNILNAIPNNEEARKIVAIRSEENEKGELNKICLLYSYYIQVNGENGYMDSVSYIPVEIDFLNRTMSIKAWTRQQISHDEHKADKLMEHTKRLLEIEFNVSVKSYLSKHKKVLFKMCKKLIDEAYENIPTYNAIKNLDYLIEGFVENTLERLELRNVFINEEGKHVLADGVMDYKSEVKNVLEGMAISDYFFDRDFKEIWGMGLEAVVARVKFNDNEQVLTSLSGEQTDTPIFCTKTFMSLKNRMEETEKTETLWIVMERKKGKLNLKFDASNSDYLEILIKYGIRFNEEDMNSALGIYRKYETKINQQIAKQSQIAVGQ